jgi:hypothetical protein
VVRASVRSASMSGASGRPSAPSSTQWPARTVNPEPGAGTGYCQHQDQQALRTVMPADEPGRHGRRLDLAGLTTGWPRRRWCLG